MKLTCTCDVCGAMGVMKEQGPLLHWRPETPPSTCRNMTADRWDRLLAVELPDKAWSSLSRDHEVILFCSPACRDLWDKQCRYAGVRQ